jgi:hypothetical protein
MKTIGSINMEINKIILEIDEIIKSENGCLQKNFYCKNEIQQQNEKLKKVVALQDTLIKYFLFGK